MKIELDLTKREAVLLALLVNVNSKDFATVIERGLGIYESGSTSLKDAIYVKGINQDLWAKVGCKINKSLKYSDQIHKSVYELNLEEIVDIILERENE